MSRFPSRARSYRHAMLAIIALVMAFTAWGGTSVKSPQDAHAEAVRVLGILAFRDQSSTLTRWRPLAEYLSQRIPGQRFEVRLYNLDGLERAVRTEAVDFVLTNSGQYVVLRSLYGLAPVANVVQSVQGRALDRFGAVIFTRVAHEGVQNLEDLRGKTLAAVAPEALGGFQMAWYEFLTHSVDPYHDLKEIRFMGLPQDLIVFAVRDGLVDAGTVRTGVLERLAQSGQIALSDFRILDQRADPGFPLIHSTALYPEWPLARLPHVPHALARDVAMALYAMDPDGPVAKATRVARWTVPLSMAPTKRLLDTLGTAPEASSVARPGVAQRMRQGMVHPAAIIILALLVVAVVAVACKRR